MQISHRDTLIKSDEKTHSYIVPNRCCGLDNIVRSVFYLYNKWEVNAIQNSDHFRTNIKLEE